VHLSQAESFDRIVDLGPVQRAGERSTEGDTLPARNPPVVPNSPGDEQPIIWNAEPRGVPDLHLRSYFDCREYKRCGDSYDERNDAYSRWMALYGRYLDICNREVDSSHRGHSVTKSSYIKQEMQELLDRIDSQEDDPFILYLKGLALASLSRRKKRS